MYRTSFFGLNTALRGLTSHQAAMDVTAQNISNIETPGYTRQRANLVATQPWSAPSMNQAQQALQMGTGVEVRDLERLRDLYVDVAARIQAGRLGDIENSVATFRQIEGVFGEPDNGVSATLSRFFDAVSDLSSSPQDSGTRQAFAAAAEDIAVMFRRIDGDLAVISAQIDARLNDTVNEINALSSRVASLNQVISASSLAGQRPNDLLDERDRVLNELSGLLDIRWTTNPATNEVTVTFGTIAPVNLVDPLAAGGFNTITRATLDNAYLSGDLTRGRAMADERMYQTTVPALMTDLNDFVASFVAGINAQHSAGFDLNGAAGGNIYDPAGLTAATIGLDPANNILSNIRLIAAADSWAAPGEPQNSDNILALMALRDQVQAAPINDTWETYWQQVTAGLGNQVSRATRDLAQQEAVTNAATQRRAEVSGVSLDEEMTAMMRFQHAYQASARVLTAMDEVLDILINRMGRVGL